MTPPFLSFKTVKNRLALLDVPYTRYKNGGGYFAGNDQAHQDPVGFEARPICFVADRPDDAPIDADAINGWLGTLMLTGEKIAQFWSITDHGGDSESAALGK